MEPQPRTRNVWVLTDTEREHIADMLGVEASTLMLKRTYMNRPQEACACCGKTVALDDLVSNALDLGVHNTGFITDVLHNGPARDSPAHTIRCSGCGTEHVGLWNWDAIWEDPAWFDN